MSKSPVTVQEWVDTLPTPPRSQTLQEAEPEVPQPTPSTTNTPARNPRLYFIRDLSQQSQQSDDGSSYCSSVESVLEQRKPDPEEVLIGLGFGPPHSSTVISRIPERFLRPSKLLPHIDINKFLEEHGLIREPDSGSPTSPARFRSKPT